MSFLLDDAGDVDCVPTRAFPFVAAGRARVTGAVAATVDDPARFARSAYERGGCFADAGVDDANGAAMRGLMGLIRTLHCLNSTRNHDSHTEKGPAKSKEGMWDEGAIGGVGGGGGGDEEAVGGARPQEVRVRWVASLVDS